MLRGSKLSLSHVDNKSDIVVRDSFSGDNYRPWIRRGRESMLDLFQQLVATLTDGDRLSTIVKFAVIASIFGLQACSPAWATTEIAKASADSSFFGDLDDIQNGFASVSHSRPVLTRVVKDYKSPLFILQFPMLLFYFSSSSSIYPGCHWTESSSPVISRISDVSALPRDLFHNT